MDGVSRDEEEILLDFVVDEDRREEFIEDHIMKGGRRNEEAITSTISCSQFKLFVYNV